LDKKRMLACPPDELSASFMALCDICFP